MDTKPQSSSVSGYLVRDMIYGKSEKSGTIYILLKGSVGDDSFDSIAYGKEATSFANAIKNLMPELNLPDADALTGRNSYSFAEDDLVIDFEKGQFKDSKGKRIFEFKEFSVVDRPSMDVSNPDDLKGPALSQVPVADEQKAALNAINDIISRIDADIDGSNVEAVLSAYSDLKTEIASVLIAAGVHPGFSTTPSTFSSAPEKESIPEETSSFDSEDEQDVSFGAEADKPEDFAMAELKMVPDRVSDASLEPVEHSATEDSSRNDKPAEIQDSTPNVKESVSKAPDPFATPRTPASVGIKLPLKKPVPVMKSAQSAPSTKPSSAPVNQNPEPETASVKVDEKPVESPRPSPSGSVRVLPKLPPKLPGRPAFSPPGIKRG